jgi:hypothetical protein
MTGAQQPRLRQQKIRVVRRKAAVAAAVRRAERIAKDARKR